MLFDNECHHGILPVTVVSPISTSFYYLTITRISMPKTYREVYTIVRGDGPEKKDRWVRIGTSFTNRDGSEDVVLYLSSLLRFIVRTAKALVTK